MKIDIPYEIGTEVVVKGERIYINGLDIYVNKKGEVTLIRAMNQYGTYTTLERSRPRYKNKE